MTTVQDEGVEEATGVVTLNFEGSGVTAVDQGGGVVDIQIPGASVNEDDVVPLIFAFGDLT